MGRKKALTRAQVESRKAQAVRFTRAVVGDPGRADEIEDESLESYAERRKLKLENPPKMERPAVPVVRKRGKLWAAYPTKEDAMLRRNEIAAASSNEKLRAFLEKSNPARRAEPGNDDDTITCAVEILQAAYTPEANRNCLVEAIRGALEVLTGGDG